MHISYLSKFLIGNFCYGFIKSMGAENQNELISEKLTASIISGFCYMNPLIIPINLHKLSARIEIKLNNKNPLEYKYYYEEPFQYRRINYNTI